MAPETLPGATLDAIAVLGQTYRVSNSQTQETIKQQVSQVLGFGFLSLSATTTANQACYQEDFYAWTQQTAALIRAGQWSAIDQEALAEEVEDLGRSQQDKLASHLLVLLTHLLKLQLAATHLPHDYARAARVWRLTCKAQRLQIAKVLRRNPRLRPTVPEELGDVYAIARLEAAQALDIDEALVPEGFPWPDDDVLDTDFWPDTP
jgi:hypothetical protein